jgi:hypothetical protein
MCLGASNDLGTTTNTVTIQAHVSRGVREALSVADIVGRSPKWQRQSLFESANGGPDTVINLGNDDSVTAGEYTAGGPARKQFHYSLIGSTARRLHEWERWSARPTQVIGPRLLMHQVV